MSSGKKATKYISEAFRLIIITPPEDLPGEKELLRALLKAGPYSVHIRKPGKSAQALSAYLSFFEAAERKQMRIHYHADIARELGMGGVHLSFGKPARRTPPSGADGIPLSVSVHSWEDYRQLSADEVEYAFISPVFDSISKPGYKSTGQLLEPPRLRPVPLIALGGIHERNIRQVCEAGYQGAAVLGAIWQNPEQALEKVESLKWQVESLKRKSRRGRAGQ